MCATHNVGRSSMVVIQQELEKGAQVTDEIMIGKRPWKDLFTKHTFFTSGFRYYLTVMAASRTKKAQNAWSGFVESRVRLLVNKLEMHQSIALARPFNKGYDRVHRCKNNAQVEEVVSAGSLAYLYKPPADGEDGVKTEAKTEPQHEIKSENGMPIKQEHSDQAPPQPATNIKSEPMDGAEVDLKLGDIPEKKDELEPMEIYTTNHYIGLQLVEGAKSLDLSREVNDWKAMCTSNDLFEEGVMFLSIQHVKNTALPDDVFEPGETKPRPVKKSLKRLASEEPGNKQQPPAKRQVQGKAPVPAQQQRQRQQQPASTAAAAAG
jgi:poly(A) polymerase